VANTLITLYGKQGSLDPEISDDFRAGDVRHCFADTSAAEELLNFEPEVGFEAGMRELVGWGQERSASDNFEEAYSELESKGLLEE
jgi:dTDP-L-rhamnose 4-epimerase